jgi:hypothetical protein
MTNEELVTSAIKQYSEQCGEQVACKDASFVTSTKVHLQTKAGVAIVEYLRSELLTKKAIEEYTDGMSSGVPSSIPYSTSKYKVQTRDAEGAESGECGISDDGRLSFTNSEEETNNIILNANQEMPQEEEVIDKNEEMVITPGVTTRNLDPINRTQRMTIGASLLAFIGIASLSILSTSRNHGLAPSDIAIDDYKKDLVEKSSYLEILSTADPRNPSTVLVAATHSKPRLAVLSFAQTLRTAKMNAGMKCMDRLNISSDNCKFTVLGRGYIAIVEGEHGTGISTGANTANDAFESASKMCIKMSEESGHPGNDCDTVFKYKF